MEEKKSKIYVVAGMGMGDEGKGTTVEHVVRSTGSTLVTRFSGGPQPMHHIQLPDGRWHCFAQFGSGTLACLVPKVGPPVITLQSRYMLLNPRTLLNEASFLVRNFQAAENIQACMKKFVRIDNECFIVTPLHQLQNRILETLRSEKDRHGTTGMGVGNAVTDVFHSFPELLPRGREVSKVDDPEGKKIGKLACIQIKDLSDEKLLFKKLQKLYHYKTSQVNEILAGFRSLRNNSKKEGVQEYISKKLFNDKYRKEIGMHEEIEFDENSLKLAEQYYMDFISEHTVDSLFNFYRRFWQDFHDVCFVDGSEVMKKYIMEGKPIVFEGSQGCLIDRLYGIFPHITKTLCSNDNILALLSQTDMVEGRDYDVHFIGVFRAYAIRHGHGPLVSVTPSWNAQGCAFNEPHNQTTKWQGAFRSGPFDRVGMKYGLEIFGKVDMISMTCIDRMIKYYREAEEKKVNLMDVDGFPEFAICNGYIVPGSVEGIDQILEGNQDRFVSKKLSSGEWVVNEIKRAEMERYYKSLDLLKITKWSRPDYKVMDELGEGLKKKPEMTEGEKRLREVALKEMIKRGLCKEGERIGEKMADYIVFAQRVLGVNIGILSFGPSYEDKAWVINIT